MPGPAILSEPLREYLRAFSGTRIQYVPNPGNAGDAMIASATGQLFASQGIAFNVLDYQTSMSVTLSNRDTVFYGGGAFISQSPSQRVRKFIERHHARVRRLVLLPHTVTGNEDLLRSLDSNVDLICRETFSFDHVRENAPRANVFLMPDVAFGLDIEDIFEGRRHTPGNLPHVLKESVRRLYYSLHDSTQAVRLRFLDDDVLSAFRGDKERTSIEIPERNCDVSATMKRSVVDLPTARAVTKRLLLFLNRFQTIRTNRLHVAIGGALLGKHVDFYPNNYFKNRAVFEYSLRSHFPGVIWKGNGTDP